MDPTISRRALLAGIAGLAALPLTACAAGPGGRVAQPADLVRAAGVSRRRPSAGAPVGAASAGMVAFGHALCRSSAKRGENWVGSPLSIACAFAMARAGADGATAAALDTFFGFPGSGRDDAFNAITRSLVTTDGPPGPRPSPSAGPFAAAAPVVTLGNALFAARGLAVRDAFLTTLAAEYGAGVRVEDFTTGAGLKAVNAWVSQETAGRIPVLFSSLDPSTQFVIANTVFLRASWVKQFAKVEAAAETFVRADGRSVSASMMHDVGVWDYASGTAGWTALSLPYASGNEKSQVSDLAMWLILPPQGGDPVDMLAPEILTAVGGSWRQTPVDVAVPKWDFATSIDLGQVLSGLGLGDVFADGDFTGIAAGIHGISSAVHRANITVDESGTEAAAATGLAFPMSAMAPPDATFHADRPFAFTIVGGGDRTPLFSGVVNDPSTS